MKNKITTTKKLKKYRPEGAMTTLWFSNWIGKKRWNKVIKYVHSKYGTKRIALGYHTKGGGPHVYILILNKMKHIGGFGEVEAKANKRKK